jgi:hypothetical protein
MGIGSAVAHYDENGNGYEEGLVDRVISEVRTDLDYFTDAEAQILQNHGYLLAEVATRCHAAQFRDSDAPQAHAPYADWLDPDRVESALAESNVRRKLGRWRVVQDLKGQP